MTSMPHTHTMDEMDKAGFTPMQIESIQKFVRTLPGRWLTLTLGLFIAASFAYLTIIYMELVNLHANLQAGFASVNAHFDAILENTSGRFTTMETNSDNSFALMETNSATRFAEIHARFDSIDTRLNSIDTRISDLIARIDHLNDRNRTDAPAIEPLPLLP